MAKSKKSSTELKLSEADLEQYGTDLLILDGWRAFKTDPVSDRSRGKGFGEKGMADHLYLRYWSPDSRVFRGVITIPPSPLGDAANLTLGEILWIEWKRRKGKAKPHQIEWIELERKRGALVWLADVDFVATPEGFFSHYQTSGLMRKRITPSFELISL